MADPVAAAADSLDDAPAPAHGVARLTANRSALTTLDGVGSEHLRSSVSTHWRMASPLLENEKTNEGKY